MVKIRYETDPYNRLVVNTKQGRSPLSRYRRVIDGRFKIKNGNTLTYVVRSPQDVSFKTPHEIDLKGLWSLTKDHDLKIELERSGKSGHEGSLVISGSIIEAGKNFLRFAVTSRSADGVSTSYLLELTGSWQADSGNRLTFRITKGLASTGILTFYGVWDINKDNILVYRYEKRTGLNKTSDLHEVVFKGRWDITQTFGLTYTIDRKSNSSFNFRSGLASFKKDRIEYEIGVGSSRKLRPSIKTVIIYGRWVIRPGSALSFEVETAGVHLYSLSFNAQASLTDRDTVIFQFKASPYMRDKAISLELSRKVLGGQGEAFIKYLKDRESHSVFVGMTKPW